MVATLDSGGGSIATIPTLIASTQGRAPSYNAPAGSAYTSSSVGRAPSITGSPTPIASPYLVGTVGNVPGKVTVYSAPAMAPAAIATPSAIVRPVSAAAPVAAPGTGAAVQTSPGGVAGGLSLTGLTGGANWGTIALVAGGLFLIVVLLGRRKRR